MDALDVLRQAIWIQMFEHVEAEQEVLPAYDRITSSPAPGVR
jgi:hypothetical protein